VSAILLSRGACDPVGIEPAPASDDATLAAAIAARDERALAEAYRRHGPNCFALARRVLVDRTLAEEVVQEIFVRLWNDPARYEPARGSLRSYLVAQAHGRSVDLLRAETARRRREEKEARQRLEPTLDLEREIVSLNEGEAVRDALAALRSSSPTSAVTPTEKSRRCSSSPKAR
jgi:RNA polymerase sigma-70 factor (ECF subfamily)